MADILTSDSQLLGSVGGAAMANTPFRNKSSASSADPVVNQVRDWIGGNKRPSAPDPEAEARTLAALQSLPSALRAVLVLREVEGLSMEDVAARLGISVRAAERRWMRAVVVMTSRLRKMEQ